MKKVRVHNLTESVIAVKVGDVSYRLEPKGMLHDSCEMLEDHFNDGLVQSFILNREPKIGVTKLDIADSGDAVVKVLSGEAAKIRDDLNSVVANVKSQLLSTVSAVDTIVKDNLIGVNEVTTRIKSLEASVASLIERVNAVQTVNTHTEEVMSKDPKKGKKVNQLFN